VESRASAESGETVVAVIGGEATIKRFHREPGGRVRLQPANERVAPIFCEEEALEIRGVVVGLMRRYGTPLRAARAAQEHGSAR
jgi:repressor LexA